MHLLIFVLLGKGVGDNKYAYYDKWWLKSLPFDTKKHTYTIGKKVTPFCSPMQEAPSVQ